MKTSQASLERKRPLLLLAGLVFALSVTLVSFEWRTPYKAPVIPEYKVEYEGWECGLPPVIPEHERLEKPELPKEFAKTTQIEVVADNQKVVEGKTELPFFDVVEPSNGSLVESGEGEVSDPPVTKIYEWVAEEPEYCGGDDALTSFLHEELTYPEIPRVNGISGTVYVRFVVGKNGKLRDAQVVRPVDPWLDAEALRVAKMLDCFTPGRNAGMPVDVYFLLPIRFALN